MNTKQKRKFHYLQKQNAKLKVDELKAKNAAIFFANLAWDCNKDTNFYARRLAEAYEELDHQAHLLSRIRGITYHQYQGE